MFPGNCFKQSTDLANKCQSNNIKVLGNMVDLKLKQNDTPGCFSQWEK